MSLIIRFACQIVQRRAKDVDTKRLTVYSFYITISIKDLRFHSLVSRVEKKNHIVVRNDYIGKILNQFNNVCEG